MLPNRSLWSPPTSGFVPFSPAGLLDEDDVVVEAPAVARAPAFVEVPLAHDPAVAAPALRPTARTMAWEPATTARVRRVELAVLAGVCGYFAFGLGKLLGLL